MSATTIAILSFAASLASALPYYYSSSSSLDKYGTNGNGNIKGPSPSLMAHVPPPPPPRDLPPWEKEPAEPGNFCYKKAFLALINHF